MRVSRATIFFSVLVSIFLFVPYVRAAEIDFRRVTAAKADVLLHPKNADAWQNLSDAYYQIIDAHRDLSLSDLTVDWRNAEHRALELRYGSLTNPRTVQEALELATIFSNQWQGPCQGMRQCYDETEPGFYRALVASLKQKTWDLTSPAESQAATELNRHY
ncbi:MAG TPA: hypothetical protein VFQ60_01260, partial [Patescibacteria group bacterium]|nr:hypothetical protein [Patescibacteria group bacterium]